MTNDKLAADAAPTPEESKVDPRVKFSRAFAEWLASRAAYVEDDHVGDEELTRRSERYFAAELALIATPAGNQEEFFQKWELLEKLIAEERVIGERTYPIAILTVAALKADILAVGFKEEEA